MIWNLLFLRIKSVQPQDLMASALVSHIINQNNINDQGLME
jgi:hypothetical protein